MPWVKDHNFLAFAFSNIGIPLMIGYANFAFLDISSFFFSSKNRVSLVAGQTIIFKSESFKFIKRTEIYAENDYNFAGRPPIQCDLIYKPDNKKISIINPTVSTKSKTKISEKKETSPKQPVKKEVKN